MVTTTADITTINDLADAYTVLNPTTTRQEHLDYLLMGACKLGIPVTAGDGLTDEQAEALDAWWNEI